MSWRKGRAYAIAASGNVGPAGGGFLKSFRLTAPVAGSATLNVLDGSGGTILWQERAALGATGGGDVGIWYKGQATATLTGGTAVLVIGPGAGTAL